MALARRRTGLTDFGDTSFEEPLAILLRSYHEEANLGAFGRFGARWDTLRFLTNLLLLREMERRNPSILGQSIDRPIFITGLPRSGSTFLHDILCQDPANRVVRCWETIYPTPRRGDWSAHSRRSRKKVDRQLAGFARLEPELRDLHPISAVLPQECTEIMGHVFRSLRFDTTHQVPGYRSWLDNAGHLPAYRFHERFLKHIQHHEGPGRWILKCPDHVFALSSLRAVYPDAGIVFMHRDPLDVLPSVARLTEVLRRPFARSVDHAQIGRQVSDRWARGAAAMVEASEDDGTSDRIFHIKFRNFLADPMRCVTAFYDRFDMPLGREAVAAMQSYIAARPNGGYAGLKSRLEDYGLEGEVERRRYRNYTAYFNI